LRPAFAGDLARLSGNAKPHLSIFVEVEVSDPHEIRACIEAPFEPRAPFLINAVRDECHMVPRAVQSEFGLRRTLDPNRVLPRGLHFEPEPVEPEPLDRPFEGRSVDTQRGRLWERVDDADKSLVARLKFRDDADDESVCREPLGDR